MKILFAGEGGQGVQAIAQILAKAVFLEGKHALYIPNFGVEQRGGVSLAFLVIQEAPVAYPKFSQADILAILADRCDERVKPYQGRKTKLVLGPAVCGGLKTDLPPKVWNVFVLGQVNQLGKIVSQNTLIQATEERFASQFRKQPMLKKLDIRALKQ